jgi:hypothetical protein
LIPEDGRWLFRFDSRSDVERAQRFIQAQKFYKTLPHKIDQAIEEVTEPTEPIKYDFKEEGTFGEDGWSISLTAPWLKKEQQKTNSTNSTT